MEEHPIVAFVRSQPKQKATIGAIIDEYSNSPLGEKDVVASLRGLLRRGKLRRKGGRTGKFELDEVVRVVPQ